MQVNRRALCVGINKFQYLPSATLQGCVNDVKAMEAVLIKYLGFDRVGDDIVELTDKDATKANIIRNLKEMVEGTKAGKYNYIVFSMSSHGTQVPDPNQDEPDLKDEAFCPTDLQQKGANWDPDHVITDDELNDLFKKLPKNVLLEVFLDTCHSGTGLKAIDLLLDRTPRFLPPPSLEGFEQMEERQLVGFARKLSESSLREIGGKNHILWAACKADQTASDAKIGSDWHGAFTYYLCQEINALKKQQTINRAKLLQKVRQQLKANKYTQVPQLETEATKRNVDLF